MQIIKNTVALIHYTLKNDAGEVLDTSEGSDPLSYLHGAGNIVPGLESELEGKAVGESIEVRVEPADGYGEKVDERVQTVPRDKMPAGMELEVGMQLEAQSPDGQAQVVTIVGLTNTDVGLVQLFGCEHGEFVDEESPCSFPARLVFFERCFAQFAPLAVQRFRW